MLSVHVGEKVALARKYQAPSLTQEELANLLDNKPSRVGLARRESKGTFKREEVTKIARVTNIPEQWFWDGGESPPPIGQSTPGNSASSQSAPTTHRNAARVGQRNIPVLATITAGEPWAQFADAEIEVVPEWGGEFERWGRVVEGDSMSPVLRSGDIAIFENRRVEQNQVVHAFDSGVDTVKCYRVVKGLPELWPFNEEHEPRSAKDWNFKGVCVARIRYGRRKKRSYTDFPGGLTWSDRDDDE